MTGRSVPGLLQAAVAAGCVGFVHKQQGLGELVETIRAVHSGAAVFPATMVQQLNHGAANLVGMLSGREVEVLQELARAKTVSEIAAELELSVNTVRNHVSAILAKLDARSQLEAVLIGLRSGSIAL